MKITINLNDAQTKGIKAYLKDTGDSSDKKAVEVFIHGIIDATLQSPHEAVSDYINQQTQ